MVTPEPALMLAPEANPLPERVAVTGCPTAEAAGEMLSMWGRRWCEVLLSRVATIPSKSGRVPKRSAQNHDVLGVIEVGGDGGGPCDLRCCLPDAHGRNILITAAPGGRVDFLRIASAVAILQIVHGDKVVGLARVTGGAVRNYPSISGAVIATIRACVIAADSQPGIYLFRAANEDSRFHSSFGPMNLAAAYR